MDGVDIFVVSNVSGIPGHDHWVSVTVGGTIVGQVCEYVYMIESIVGASHNNCLESCAVHSLNIRFLRASLLMRHWF